MTDRPARRMHPMYRLHWNAARFLYHTLLPTRAMGLENVPAEGGAIIAPNHMSFLDPPLVGSLIGRPVYYLARSSLMKHGWSRKWLTSINVVPLHREGISVGAIRQVVGLVRGGELALIFPEGTRQPEGRLAEGAGGVGLLVARCGAPVVPVRIRGTGRAMPRGRLFPRPTRLCVRFGPPLRFDPPARRSEASEHYRAIAREIMCAIGEIGPCTPEGEPA